MISGHCSGSIRREKWGHTVTDNPTGQSGQPGGTNGGKDDSSRYPAGQQWQQPSSSDEPHGQAAPSQPYGQQSLGTDNPMVSSRPQDTARRRAPRMEAPAGTAATGSRRRTREKHWALSV